jgi:hypothetical protein
MEEIIIEQESAPIAALRLNVELIGYLVSTAPDNPSIVTLVEKHSDFILELSTKIMRSARLDIKLVK